MDIEMKKKCSRRVRARKIPYQDHEIWYEILARLSFKSLFVCRSVCKSWVKKVFILRQQSKPLPLCGFIFKSTLGVSDLTNLHMPYLNFSTKQFTTLRPYDPQSLIVSIASNGVDDFKFMSDLTFDFTRLFASTPFQEPVSFRSSNGGRLTFDFNGFHVDTTKLESHSCFFAIHRGLVLVVHDDGNYIVFNPLTKTVTQLPKPPSFNQFNSKCIPLEKAGFIIKCNSNTLRCGWFYHVVRICRISKVIEVFQSYPQRPLHWTVSQLVLDEELMQAYWCWENNALLPRSKSLFFLTNTNRGVAVRYGPHHLVRAYGFALPGLVQQGFKNARLGHCGGCLHLSYYTSSGVWIWKHRDNDKSVTPKAWIPLFEISHHRQLSKPLAMECLCSYVLNAGNSVVPLAFHPDAAVVFLCIQSHIVAYDLVEDTFDKITVTDEIEHESSTILMPYSPCLAFVQASLKLEMD